MYFRFSSQLVVAVMIGNACRFLLLCVVCYCSDPALEDEEIRARAYMQLLNKKSAEDANLLALASWNYQSNITEYNFQNYVSRYLQYLYIISDQMANFKYILPLSIAR